MADNPYKIYDYIDAGVLYDMEPPAGVDFRRGLTIRLHPKRTITNGELVECIHYAVAVPNPGGWVDYSIPVVKETWVYDRNPVSHLANYRVHTIEWYLEDETLGAGQKVEVKYYDTVKLQLEEIARKRKNEIDSGAETAIFYRILTIGTDAATAMAEGQQYWKEVVTELSRYVDGDRQPLIDRLTNDTTPTWLDDAPAGGGATVRQAILASIDTSPTS